MKSRRVLLAFSVLVVILAALLVIVRPDNRLSAENLEASTPSGDVRVSIPRTGHDDPVRIDISRATDHPALTFAGEVTPGGKSIELATPIGHPVSIEPDRSPGRGGEVTLAYRPDELPDGTVEADVFIAVRDEAAGRWLPLRSVVDAGRNTVTAKTPHFSLFSAFVGAGKRVARTIANEAELAAKQALDDATLRVKTLDCGLEALDYIWKVESPTSRVKACVEHSRDLDKGFLLHIQNRHATAIAFRLPNGVWFHDMDAGIQDGAGPYLRQLYLATCP